MPHTFRHSSNMSPVAGCPLNNVDDPLANAKPNPLSHPSSGYIRPKAVRRLYAALYVSGPAAYPVHDLLWLDKLSPCISGSADSRQAQSLSVALIIV